MEQINITDAWLYKYMPMVDEAIITEVEKNVDKNYIFSERFLKEMRKTIYYEKSIEFKSILAKIGKCAAIFILVVISSVFTITMSVKAYRVHFFETVKTIWEDSFFYTYFTENDEIDVEKYNFNYLPEGYKLLESSGNDNTITTIYENKNGEQLIIDQHLVSDKREIMFDLEYSTEREVDVKGINLDIYRYEDGFASAYYEYGNTVVIISADNLSDNEFIQIIENMNL